MRDIIEDFDFVAGVTIKLDIPGTFFAILTGTDDVLVKLLKRGSVVAQFDAVQSGLTFGDNATVTFDAVAITSTTTQTLKLAIGGDKFSYSKSSGLTEITGGAQNLATPPVEEIVGGANNLATPPVGEIVGGANNLAVPPMIKTERFNDLSENNFYIGSWLPVVNFVLLNPVGSLYNMSIRMFQLFSPVYPLALALGFMGSDAGNAGISAAVNKKSGGRASGATYTYDTVANAIVNNSTFFNQFNRDITYTLDPPIILTPGSRFGLVGANTAFYCLVEFSEMLI